MIIKKKQYFFIDKTFRSVYIDYNAILRIFQLIFLKYENSIKNLKKTAGFILINSREPEQTKVNIRNFICTKRGNFNKRDFIISVFDK